MHDNISRTDEILRKHGISKHEQSEGRNAARLASVIVLMFSAALAGGFFYALVRIVRWLIPVLAIVTLAGCEAKTQSEVTDAAVIRSQREYIERLRDFLNYETCPECRAKWYAMEEENLVDGDTLYPVGDER